MNIKFTEKEKKLLYSDATELDNVAFFMFLKYLESDDFLNIMCKNMNIEKDNYSFSDIKQEQFICMKNNVVLIDEIYNITSNYLRQIKINKIKERLNA